MNERIKELAEQAITEKLSLDEFIAALKKEPHDFYGFRRCELEKFAELIIRECAKCITTGTYSADPPYDKIIPVLLDVLTNNMMQHFGVEE